MIREMIRDYMFDLNLILDTRHCCRTTTPVAALWHTAAATCSSVVATTVVATFFRTATWGLGCCLTSSRRESQTQNVEAQRLPRRNFDTVDMIRILFELREVWSVHGSIQLVRVYLPWLEPVPGPSKHTNPFILGSPWPWFLVKVYTFYWCCWDWYTPRRFPLHSFL